MPDRIRYLAVSATIVSLVGSPNVMIAAVPTAPVNTVAPSISGTPKVGLSLFANAGTWTSAPAPTFTYQWRQCDAAGDNCADIAGATGSFYNPKAADAGLTIRLVVTASNGAEDASATSDPTAPVTRAPSMSVLPSISGNAIAGEALTASAGTWAGYPAPTYAYQWRLCDASFLTCNNIAGATGSTYTVAVGDIGSAIRVAVTATNSAGSSSASSNQTAVVTGAPPVNTAPPSISGTPVIGQQLTVSDGTWTGAPTPTYSYQWQRCDAGGASCLDISGATTSTYTLVSADLDMTIRVTVNGTNAVGNSSATSSQTASITPPPTSPSSTAAPTISGTTTVGETLAATTGAWTGYPVPALTHQWYRCDSVGANCVPITGANAATYTLASADALHTIRVGVTGTNSAGSSSASSVITSGVAPMPIAPTQNAAPSVNGSLRDGEVLTARPGGWYGVPTPVVTYQWQRCDAAGANCADISGETRGTYTVRAFDIGSTIWVVVTAINSAGSATAIAGAAVPVLAGKIGATQSKVYSTPADSMTGAAASDSVPADGSRFSRVRIELRDAAGNLVTGLASNVLVTIDGVASASPVRETSTRGVYEVEVRSTKPNTAMVSISVDGVTLQDRARIVFVKAVADLDIKLSASNETPQIGDVVVFTVEVKNLGPNAATGVEVEHKLSDRVTYVSSEATRGQYDAATGLWTVGGLALGETALLKVTVKVTK